MVHLAIIEDEWPEWSDEDIQSVFEADWLSMEALETSRWNSLLMELEKHRLPVFGLSARMFCEDDPRRLLKQLLHTLSIGVNNLEDRKIRIQQHPDYTWDNVNDRLPRSVKTFFDFYALLSRYSRVTHNTYWLLQQSSLDASARASSLELVRDLLVKLSVATVKLVAECNVSPFFFSLHSSIKQISGHASDSSYLLSF
jgi:hypothetical protein